jgi:amidase
VDSHGWQSNTTDVVKIVPKECQHFLFDKQLAPVLTVAPGESVTFQTLDACCGEVRSVEQFLARRKTDRKSNPINGPVFIEGAKPGGTLVVEIVGVELDRDGFQLIGPNRGIVRDEVPEWTCYAFRVEGDRVTFPNGLVVHAMPVIGQFGNASAGEPTNLPGPLGGNMDCPFVRAGAKLFIPIAVPGALFSLGDVHACQGDGEVVGAPEIGARVTVRFDVREGRHSDWFMIEDAMHWYTCGTAQTEAEAARLATLENARFIQRTQGIEFKDALILLTLIGRLSLSRTQKWGAHNPVVCASFSKAELTRAMERM